MSRRTLLDLSGVFVASIAAVVLALECASAGRAAPPAEPPDVFLARIVSRIASDRYALAWQQLYAPGKAVAPKAEYVRCETRTPVGWKVESVTTVGVVERLASVPGVARPIAVELVTLRVRFSNDALATEGIFTHTFRAVSEGGRWAWVFTPSRYAMYRDDAC